MNRSPSASNAKLSTALAQVSQPATSWGLSDHAGEVGSPVVQTETSPQGVDDAVRLIGAVSHEMRNPLNGILGMAHLLADTSLDSAQRNYLDAIRTSGDVLLTLVNDLLDLTALQSGTVPIKLTPCDVDQLVNQTLELAAPSAHARGLALGSTVDPAIDFPLPMDGGRVRQILTNLVSNAIKFTETGGVRVDVRLAFLPAPEGEDFRPMEANSAPIGDGAIDAEIVFDVTDTGAGVSPREQALIFEPFGRTKSAHMTGTEGTGLGLPLSRGLALAMGGSLELVHSAPGAGTRMRLTVPVRDCALTLPPADGPLDGRRVLIVMPAQADGQSSLEADTLDDTLTTLGASVRRVCDAAELNGPPHNIDHVLIDSRFDHAVLWARLCLPGTGIRPVVLIRPDQRSDLSELRAAGFGGYLMRPIRRASLVALLTDSFETAAPTAFRNDPADRKAEAQRAGPQSKRVLLADDSPVNALLVSAALERAGHTVITVDDGARAIALAHDEAGSPFDLIFLDLSMPVLDGFAAARQIRAQGFKGRIIAISGNTDPEIDGKLAKAGFDGFAQKPVSPEELERLVDG